MRLRAEGMEVEVPRGWDGEIYRRGPRGGRAQGFGDAPGEIEAPVMHLANFPLPPNRGDYGSGAVEVMRSDNVLIALVEFDRASAGTALFAREGLPSVKASDFAPHQMQRTLPGQSGAQYFFHHNGRAFCLYVVLGSHARRQELVPEVNAVLSTINLDRL